jgi:hypothetical protein
VGRENGKLHFDEAAQWSLIEARTRAFAINRLVTGIAAMFNSAREAVGRIAMTSCCVALKRRSGRRRATHHQANGLNVSRETLRPCGSYCLGSRRTGRFCFC